MSRRRKRRDGGVADSQSDGQSRPPLGPPLPTLVSSKSDPEVKARQQSADALKVIVQRVADLLKSQMASAGKVGPTAIFVYEDEAGTPEAGTTKIVSLTWNSETQKETLVQRIREKALLEKASAVLMLAETDPEPRNSPRRQGVLMLSGVVPGMNVSARVDYTLGTDMKSIASWEMRYLDKPLQNVFLDSIFPMGNGSAQTDK